MSTGTYSKINRYRRRGSGYILVLGAAMLVSVIGLSSLMLTRVQWQTEQAAMNAGRARLYARSAVEAAVAYTLMDPSWRTNYGGSSGFVTMPLDRGSCSVSIGELDGSALVANADTSVLITGVGTVGNTANPDAVSRWTVQAHHPALSLLGTALHSASSINVSGADLELDNGPLSTAGTLTNSGTIHGDVEANSIVNWGWISGSRDTGVPAKQMPTTAWDYYRTLSGIVSLPPENVGYVMEWMLLSPSSNPYSSSKNADGLYYIRPWSDLRIRDCRIVGTLIVDLSWGKKLILDNGVNWAPARPDYPSLIVDGPCEIHLNSTVYEAGRVNLNPTGTPHQGASDYDRLDSYPSILQGVFQVTGSSSTVYMDNQTTLKGVLIADGAVTIRDYVHLSADPNIALCPPIKYRSSYLELDAGTWRQIISTN